MSVYAYSVSVSRMCTWCSIPRSVYYYKPGENSAGRKPSTHTCTRDGELVSNETVVQEIKRTLGIEFMDSYGYEYMSVELQQQYIINHKKVYRLMDENNLLLNKTIRTSGKRQFVKFRTINATYSLEYLSMDIKYVWVEGEKRNYYLLTVIDVYSKKALGHIFKRSIRKHDVIQLLRRIDQRNGIKGVIIRNDNGPQFIANLVKNFLRTVEVIQEFSHPATPEDNSYIEAWHSILQKTVIDKYEFESFYEAKSTIERFVHFYNNRRWHRSIDFITPQEKWQLGLALRSAVKPQPAREILSRPMESFEKQNQDPSLCNGLDKINEGDLCLTADLIAHEINLPLNLNLLNKSVQ